MMQFTQHIEVIRQKPEHIRKQIALGIAGFLTALIAFVWLTTSVATGAFALNIKSDADPSLAVTPASVSGFGSLVGAVSTAFGGSEEAAHVQVVGVVGAEVQTQKKVEAEPTILPF